jgi:transposase
MRSPGLGATGAWTILAEIGLDISRFPTPAHLCLSARFAPGVNQSAGKTKCRGATGHGNRYLGQVLGEVAVASARTSTFLGERYRRLARRRGCPGNGRDRPFHPGHHLAPAVPARVPLPRPGPGYTRRRTDPNRRARNHVHQLKALGTPSPSHPSPDQPDTADHPVPPGFRGFARPSPT